MCTTVALSSFTKELSCRLRLVDLQMNSWQRLPSPLPIDIDMQDLVSGIDYTCARVSEIMRQLTDASIQHQLRVGIVYRVGLV